MAHNQRRLAIHSRFFFEGLHRWSCYPDPGDPHVVALDTVTSDVIQSSEVQVAPYERLYERISEAALAPEESAKLLAGAADALPDN